MNRCVLPLPFLRKYLIDQIAIKKSKIGMHGKDRNNATYDNEVKKTPCRLENLVKTLMTCKLVEAEEQKFYDNKKEYDVFCKSKIERQRWSFPR
jgi:hypothetical protein